MAKDLLTGETAIVKEKAANDSNENYDEDLGSSLKLNVHIF